MQYETCKIKVDNQTVGFLDIHVISLPKKGDRIDPHRHDAGHVSCVECGSARVHLEFPSGEKVSRDVRCFEKMFIPADVLHSFEALETGTRVSCEFLNSTAGEHR